MSPIDLQPIVETSVERFWNLRTMFDGRPEWSDVDPITKMDVKNSAMPFIAHAAPEFFKQFSGQVLDAIKSGEELGVDSDTILLSIKATLTEHA